MDKEFETVTLEIPDMPVMSDEDIEISINQVLGSEEYLKELNELILDDEKERYVRELLNRLNTIIKYMEQFVKDTETGGINPRKVIAIAKGDKYEN